MKAVILTEGSTEKGFGHITRCSALVEAFRAASVNCTLVIDGDASVKQVLNGQSAILGDWIHNKKIRAAVLQNCDCVIIDSYHAPLSLYKEINARVPLLVCIDDYDRLAYPKRSIILKVEWQPHGHDRSLKKIQGPRHTTIWHELILRKEFFNAAVRRVNASVQQIFISLGATDVQSITPLVLEALTQIQPTWHMNTIIGPGFRKKNATRITKISKTKKHIHIFQNVSAKKIMQLMNQSDLAITGAGQTLNELARVGLPAIAIIVANNQVRNAHTWKKHGCIITIDGRSENSGTIKRELSTSVSSISPFLQRKKMSAAGRKLVDGKGAQRVVQEIIKVLKK